MQPQTPTDVTPPNSPEPPRTKFRAGVFAVVVLALIALAGGVYYWQHQQVTDLQASVASLKAATPPTTVTAAEPSQDVAQGVPLSIPNTKVLTTLVLPAHYGIIGKWPVTSSQPELQSHYVLAMNDFLASWSAKLVGTNANPSLTGGEQGDVLIEIAALSQWEAANDPAGVEYSFTQKSMTAAQKKAYVAKLKADTSACVKDPAKGFSTNDHVYNICYSYAPPQAQDADYGLSLSGYATINGQPVQLTGSIALPNSFSNHEAIAKPYLADLKQLSTTTSPTKD